MRTPAIEREIAQIRDELAVVKNTVRATTLSDGQIVIAFTVQTDEIGGEPAAPILDREPVAVVYPPGGVGLKGPKVYSDREDFPRDLTHLNPVPDDSPVSICLAREGHGALYERDGISGIVGRLCRWFLDAKAGTLNRGGWEPVPIAEPRRVAIIHSAAFQDFAVQAPAEVGWAVCVASLSDGAVLAIHDSLRLGAAGTGPRLRSEVEDREAGLKGLLGVPAVFVWQGADRTEHTPAFGYCTRGVDLMKTLDSLGLRDAFDEARAELAMEGWRRQALFLLVGVRRPTPMMEEIFGLSQDPEARSLELRGFLIEPSDAGRFDDPGSKVEEVLLDQIPVPALFADVSGARPSKPIFLVGYGALGSQLGVLATRMGARCAGVLDADNLRSHNLARHEGVVPEIGATKVQIHARVSACLNPFEAVSFPAERVDIVNVPSERLAEGIPPESVLLDSTASDAARRTLAGCREIPRVVRGELYGAGVLGVQSVESANRNPDVLDLYYSLCARSLVDESVAMVLRADAAARAGRERFAAGFGCASATVRMPQWKVSAHAAAFMPVISRLLEGEDHAAGLGLSPLLESGHPAGWRWMDVEEFWVQENIDGWQVRIGPGIEARVTELMEAAAPRETGGYLYGGIDAPLRRITVVIAAPEPPGTVASPTHLDLPPAGRSGEERQIRRDSGRRLAPVGSWHSHPGGGTRMSGRDASSAERFRRANVDRGLPTLLAVIAPTGLGVHVLS